LINGILIHSNKSNSGNNPMNNMSVNLPVSQTMVLAAVMNYENPKIVSSIQRKQGVTQTEANGIFADTKRFLYLCAHGGDGPYAPTRTIDGGWHEFMMYSRDYDGFCYEVLGRKVHHVPNEPNMETAPTSSVRTLKSARAVFGQENLSTNWFGETASCGDSDEGCQDA
jgi:hypothetical protein